MFCFYDILGVDKSAPTDDIRRAYRQLSLQWHPDRNGNSAESNERFKAINEAHETLTDDNLRRQYDIQKGFIAAPIAPPTPPVAQNAPSHFPFPFAFPFAGEGIPSNLFHEMFRHAAAGGGVGVGVGGGGATTFHFGIGGGGDPFGRGGCALPPAIIQNVQVSLEIVLFGGAIDVDVVRWVIAGGIKRTETMHVNVNIPAGITENDMIVLESMGNVLEDRTSSLKLCIKLENDTINTSNKTWNTWYRRTAVEDARKFDLVHCRRIPLWQALCGDTTFDLILPAPKGEVPQKISVATSSTDATAAAASTKVVLCPERRRVTSAEWSRLVSAATERGHYTGELYVEFELELPEQVCFTENNKEVAAYERQVIRRVLGGGCAAAGAASAP